MWAIPAISCFIKCLELKILNLIGDPRKWKQKNLDYNECINVRKYKT